MTRTSLKWYASSLLMVAGAALTIGTGLALNSEEQKQKTQSPPLVVQTDNAPITRDLKSGTSFAPIVKKVAPSVVKVSVTSKTGESPMAMPDNDFFRRFFGDNGDLFGPGHNRGFMQHGLGSGVVVSADGYILTNNHVVNNASEIQVALSDGRQFTAKVIGTDAKTDVALIKIKAENLPALKLTDSDKVEIGDVVLAIGNPFGIGQTVTEGIVSAKNRATSGDMDEDFIQTDAAINPGNSGGALVDTEGRLVGINSAILTRSGGNQGIGFAVPSNLCRWVMESLVKNGRVDRGYLGVVIQDITPELAKAFKLEQTNGALVSDVATGGPAEAAGLKSGDVIVQFDGKPVEDVAQFKIHVAETAPGSKVPLVVNRNGEVKNFDVTLKSLPENRTAKAQEKSDKHEEALAGVGVADLDQSIRRELNIPTNVEGAVVTEVSPDSAAYEAGLRSGDVITEINHQPVRNAQDAIADTTKPAGDQTLVKVWSKGGSHYLTVEESNEGSNQG
ncbi:MAG TPA: DegQ family serine endoprotease [Chthoniobacterales bacterium]|jgi:serine protease Do|nr:DegQ family serine endoprotease [Chthoniobacterales bacterium]